MDKNMAKSNNPSRKNSEGTGIGIKITLIAVAVLCVLALVYAIVSGTGILARSTTAMTVGKDNISAAELKQFYADTRASFMNSNGYYLQMYGYDVSSAAFDAQSCLFDSSKTWKEYFLEQAENTAQQVSILYQRAKEQGMAISETRQQEVDDFMVNIQEAADSYGYSLSKYISLAFGSGIRKSDVDAYRAKRALASTYYDSLLEGFGITDADIDAYYEENKDSYDVADYYAYEVNYETFTYDASSTEEGAPTSEEDAQAKTTASKKAAEKTANAIFAALSADGSNFDEAVRANIDNSDEGFETALYENSKISGLSGASGDWLKDAGRKNGDATLVEDEDNKCYTVCLFLDRHVSEDYTVAIRHILFKTQTAASDADEATIAEIDAANEEVKAKAEQVYEQWKSGEKTEDSFAALAKEYSEDGSASDGGLYEGVYPGQMVTEFNDWCFDAARQPGDNDIVKTPYGYHIMYFVEREGLKYRSDIKSAIESERFDEWLEGQKTSTPTTYNKKGLMLL